MFLLELQPIAREFSKNPIAFTGGFVAGLLKLNLNEEPVKSWLAKQGATTMSNSTHNNDENADTRPQKITID